MPFRPAMRRLLWAERDRQAEADRAYRQRVQAVIDEAKAKRLLNETRGRLGGWS